MGARCCKAFFSQIPIANVTLKKAGSRQLAKQSQFEELLHMAVTRLTMVVHHHHHHRDLRKSWFSRLAAHMNT